MGLFLYKLNKYGRWSIRRVLLAAGLIRGDLDNSGAICSAWYYNAQIAYATAKRKNTTAEISIFPSPRVRYIVPLLDCWFV